MLTTPHPDPDGRLDPDRFRRVLSHFCSGVVVVTAMAGAEPVGLTCQSFSSLSLEPPLVLFGVARTSRSWPRLRRAGRFAVNILAADQERTSRAFSVQGADKFSVQSWELGPQTGAPLLVGALAHLECGIYAVHDGGDHEIVVGRVLALREHEHPGPALLYFRSGYHRLG
ncbi:flavin reductase family protein [Rhizomonospora bruguierae]|uniref:flavin reductase family protein n=1 Tax=Rhizomonospora bruguierae TaxID=1581705 RepID=UPI0020C07346|nr:flavin reductase family protein [Micromonospora sp. NBRC 107566]